MNHNLILVDGSESGLNTNPKFIENRVLKDYERYLGHPIWVTHLDGMEGGEPVQMVLNQPALVRVVATESSTLLRWVDSYCAPLYRVELVQEHSQLKTAEDLLIHGPAHHLNGKQSMASNILGFGEATEPTRVVGPYRQLNVTLAVKFENKPPEDLIQLQDWLVSALNQKHSGAQLVSVQHATPALGWPDFLDAPGFGPEHPDYPAELEILKKVQGWLDMDRRELIQELVNLSTKIAVA